MTFGISVGYGVMQISLTFCRIWPNNAGVMLLFFSNYFSVFFSSIVLLRDWLFLVN